MKYITVKLTEDQARVLLAALDEYNQAVKMPVDWHNFNRRIKTIFHKALNPYITES